MFFKHDSNSYSCYFVQSNFTWVEKHDIESDAKGSVNYDLFFENVFYHNRLSPEDYKNYYNLLVTIPCKLYSDCKIIDQSYLVSSSISFDSKYLASGYSNQSIIIF